MKKSSPLHGTIMDKMVSRMYGKFDASNAITRKVLQATEAVWQLEKLAKTPNPMETDAAHAKRVAGAAGQLKAKIARLEGEISVEAGRQRDRLNREIQEKARLVPTQHAAEIRASLRAMPEKERLQAVIDALRGSDTGAEIMAAVADGNLITTGFNDDARRRFIDDFQRGQAPELYEERTDLEATLHSGEKAMRLGIEAAGEAVDPDYIERITEAERVSVEVTAAFAESVA